VFMRSSDWAGLDRDRLARQVLVPLKDGERSISYDSCYDWDNWLTRPVAIDVSHYLVLEGIGIFHPDVDTFFDVTIWLDVDLETATRQGISRELSGGRDQGQVWRELWEPNDADFFARYNPKTSADLVVRWA
jgi:hypothetical protein